MGGALGTSIASGTLTSIKSLEGFTDDLAFLFERATTKSEIRAFNNNFKKMRNPGPVEGASGIIQGRAMELTSLAELTREAEKLGVSNKFSLNRTMKHFVEGKNPTDADVYGTPFARLVSRTQEMGAESKYSDKALGTAIELAHKLLAYQRELLANGVFYFISPKGSGLYQTAKTKLQNAFNRAEEGSDEAKEIGKALKYLTKNAKALEVRVLY